MLTNHLVYTCLFFRNGWKSSLRNKSILIFRTFSVPHHFLFFFFDFINFLIYFWLHWVFVAMRGLSLVAASGGYFSLQCVGFSLRWLLLLWSMGFRCVGFSSCGSRVPEVRLSSCVSGLVAPRHVGSSRTRARTRVPCIGRQILNHWTTREVPVPHHFHFHRFV